VLAHPRLRRMPLGLSLRGVGRHLPIYGVLFAIVLVVVILASYTRTSSNYYPLYRNAHRSLFDFALWEVFYVAQFLSLEFFFRGFMIQPLRRIMGSTVIPAMMIPYCMVHFHKPMAECFGAIIAGLVLGTLALRTRSIWLGALIHVRVALSMDILAIWQVHHRGL
jgi:membrane protease YdiL (CAAX protease family)